MGILRRFGALSLLVLGGAAAVAVVGNAGDRRAAEAAWQTLRGHAEAEPEAFDPAMVADLPPVARRYFAAAIAPGTPLHRVVELEMAGTFLLDGRGFAMRSEQILAPPHGFVWRARVGSGALRFAGSDGYLDGEASWTRFWLLGLVPLARAGGTADHARAAAARMVIEAIWAPAALLPQNGAVWRETGPDSAEVRFPAVPGVEPIHLTLDAEGRVLEAATMRWSDANPERAYRLQPFGGRMLAHGRHHGFTIPVEVEVGNHYGTDAYAPFFRARLTGARYGAP